VPSAIESIKEEASDEFEQVQGSVFAFYKGSNSTGAIFSIQCFKQAVTRSAFGRNTGVGQPGDHHLRAEGRGHRTVALNRATRAPYIAELLKRH